MLPDGRRRFVGRSDPPLSATGLAQARRLAERFRLLPIDTVYSSDLQRCMTAALIIAQAWRGPRAGSPERHPSAGLDVRPDPRLREIDAGLWDFLTFEEVAQRHPREHAEREGDLFGYRFPGGESFRDVRERVVPALLDIVSRGDENIVVVTHQGVIRVLLCEFLGLPLEELFSFKQSYGCVSLVRATALPGGGLRMEVVSSDLGWAQDGSDVGLTSG